MGFEVVTAAPVNVTIFWNVTQCFWQTYTNLAPVICAPLPHGVFFCNYVKNIVHEFKQQITEISEAVTLEMLKHVWSEARYQLHICRATKGVCVEVH